ISAAVLERVKAEMSAWPPAGVEVGARSEDAGVGSRGVLDRLETDYQRLRDLVRGLSEGIATGFSNQHPADETSAERTEPAVYAAEAATATGAAAEYPEPTAWSPPTGAPESEASPGTDGADWSDRGPRAAS